EHSMGNKRLRNAWSAYIARLHGLSIDPNNFLITTGASEALIFLFMICCDPGDEVITFDPTYANYIGFAAIGGVYLKAALSTIEDGFALPERREIEGQIT